MTSIVFKNLTCSFAIVFICHAARAEEKHIAPIPEIEHQTQKLLEAGESCMDQADWQCANDKLKQGIALLGDSYVDKHILDDTGQKLVIAQMQEKDGNLKTSANLYDRVLVSRLQVLRSRASQ
jgi:hypothetical protein